MKQPFTHMIPMGTNHAALIRSVFLIVIFLTLLIPSFVYAQDCNVNAGGSALVCGSSTTLVGAVENNAGAGGPTWTFVSGPATPTIVSPTEFTTNVTGMTVDGAYVFQLSHACGTGTATSQVTITARAKPASFTAGTDVTGICATVGTTTLAGVIPAGFTGQWRSVNIFARARNSSTVSTNSEFSNTTSATPTFSLTNKANHTIDPAYWAILKITSVDGLCSYEDTTVVRFTPNPQILFPTTRTACRPAGSTDYFIDPLPNSPVFNTNYAGSAGTVANGTIVNVTVLDQPVGAAMTFNRMDEFNGRIYFNGMNVDGAYRFTVTVTNSCGTHTTPEITFTYSGTSPNLVNFQISGRPEQMVFYATTGSGGEVHCSSKVGSTTPEDFYFNINALDNAADVTTSVTPSGITPPGGFPTVTVTGAGNANRKATVTPPSGGWQVGTYRFTVTPSFSGSCGRNQFYYIHVSDSNRPDVAVVDQNICYPGTGAISAEIPLPAIYKGVVNSSYFQDFSGIYKFSVVSKPAGSGNPTYGTDDQRAFTLTSTTIGNLTTAGDYVFQITAAPITTTIGAFLNAEYACASTVLTNTFTIHVENRVNANAGSDVTGACPTTTLLGNNPGASAGTWTLVSAPSGATPTIATPSAPNTGVTNMNVEGVYRFLWTINSPLGACISADEVTYTVSSTPPVLNGTTLGNTCPDASVSLSSMYPGTVPTGTTLVWFNNSSHTGSPVSNPATVSTAGTYYAFLQSTGGCYSLPSSAVTVTIDDSCCAAGDTAPVINP